MSDGFLASVSGWRRVLPFALALAMLCSISYARADPSQSLQFDGTSAYVEVADSPDFSVATTGSLTVSAWMRPDVLTFPSTEGSGYVYWLGKGGPRQYEWALRVYSQGNSEGRHNRISFYVFNPAGGLGIGSYFEDPVTPGQWIHVVAAVDGALSTTSIYKNGVFRRCDQYSGPASGTCERHVADGTITPQHGSAPLRFGTLDSRSFFEGALADVRVWKRALTPGEIAALYASDLAPSDGLVAEYRLDEGIGSTAHDSVGGHDGTIVGGCWPGARASATSAGGSLR